MPESASHEHVEVLRQVLELARAQRGALERDDLDEFDAVLARREALLQAGGVVQAADATADAVALPVSDVALTDDDAAAIDALVQRILAQDQANEALLGARIAEIRGEMPALTKGHQANAAYRMSERPSTFINRVS